MVANENRRRYGERSFTEAQMLEVVALSNYKDLLRLQRFEPVGSLWFTTPSVAEAISARMRLLRDPAGHVQASKEIGW